MIYRAIVFYFAVQSVVVASPAVGQHGDSVVSPIGTFYRPTPASRVRGGIPEVGKLPRPAVVSKKLPVGVPVKLTPVKLRSGRNPVIDTYQPQRTRTNHIQLEDSYQRPRSQLSEEEKAEKINSDLEKMIQFMTVLGQVDRYLSSKAKSFVTMLGRAMENTSDDRYNERETSSYDY